MQRLHRDGEDREQRLLDLDEIARAGARRMLAEALEAEVQDYLDATRGERDEQGHALVVRNGHADERKVVCGAGSVEVRAPRVNDRRLDEDGNRQRFKSVILPRERFMSGDFSGRDYVYIWVDGIHTGVRLGSDERLCCLVMLGARLDGTKELVALADGYRESTESWACLLRDLKKRGMRAPEVAVGDGALGFWGAIRDVFPETHHQRDWVHKTMNILDSMPKSVHSWAKAAIHEITEAEDRKEAERAIKEFADEFGAKWPKAVARIEDDKEALLTFYDYPAEHWRHLRTTNPIESVFAPVRARTDFTKGPGSRQAGLAMIFKLMEAAEGRWRKLTGAHLVALVRVGAEFRNGELIEGSEEKVAA